jgi:hypothetical protein
MLGVQPEWVGIIGAGMLLLGPLVWGFVRQTRGLPAFDNIADAWHVPHKNGRQSPDVAEPAEDRTER